MGKAVKPLLNAILNRAPKTNVEKELQKAQKKLVLGCLPCWKNYDKDIVWVHSYVEPEDKLKEEIEGNLGTTVSDRCFLHKAAGISVPDEVPVAFYGGTNRISDGKEEHWGTLIPLLMDEALIPVNKRKKVWLSNILATPKSPPLFKLWLENDSLKSEPHRKVHKLYKCIFEGDRASALYLHIAYPCRDTELANHVVGPAGCYLLLRSQQAIKNMPPCLVFHLRAFVQALVTAQIWGIALQLQEGQQLRNQELEKYQSIYNQLLRPLRSLTKAVRQTQVDSHEITALLYDPLDVLLASQIEIAQLFEDGETVPLTFKGEGTKLTIKHNPATEYTADEVCLLAVEVFHRIVPETTSLTEKTFSASEMLGATLQWLCHESENTKSAFYGFVEALRRFIDTDQWQYKLNLTQHTKTWRGVSKNVTDASSAIPIATQFLLSVKERFFTLYKPDNSNAALTWEVVRAYLATIRCNNNTLDLPRVLDGNVTEIVTIGSNPFNTQGHIVDFIGRVLAQHCSYWYRQTIKIPDLKFLSKTVDEDLRVFIIESEREWVPDIEGFAVFLRQQRKHREDKVRARREFGDRKLPFVDMIERIPDEVNLDICADHEVLKVEIGELAFEFSKQRFSIISKIRCGH